MKRIFVTISTLVMLLSVTSALAEPNFVIKNDYTLPVVDEPVTYTMMSETAFEFEGADMELPVIENEGQDLFDCKIRSFLDAVKYNKTTPVPTSQILYNQAIIDGIVRSSYIEREVEIRIPEI